MCTANTVASRGDDARLREDPGHRLNRDGARPQPVGDAAVRDARLVAVATPERAGALRLRGGQETALPARRRRGITGMRTMKNATQERDRRDAKRLTRRPVQGACLSTS